MHIFWSCEVEGDAIVLIFILYGCPLQQLSNSSLTILLLTLSAPSQHRKPYYKTRKGHLVVGAKGVKQVTKGVIPTDNQGQQLFFVCNVKLKTLKSNFRNVILLL